MSSTTPDDSVSTIKLFNGRTLAFFLGGVGAVMVVGLLIVGVNKIRLASMVATSKDQLRKFAEAIHSYHDANNSQFPSLCDFGPGSQTGNGIASLHYLTLPYLESSGFPFLLNQTNPETYYRSPYGIAGNDKVSGFASFTLPYYISPFEPRHDSDAPVYTVEVASPNAVDPFQRKFIGWYATANYVANGMVFSPQPDEKIPSIKTVNDGTSHTIMLAERHQVCKSPNGDVPTLWGLGAYSASTASFALSAPTGDHPKATDTHLMLNQFVPPQSVPKDAKLPVGFQVLPKAGTCDPRAMQTFNPSGMIVAMFDGSVKVIAPTIEPASFWALVTPNGSENATFDNW